VEPEQESLTEAFWSVSRALRHQSKITMGPYDLTPSQGRALGELMRHGAMRPSDLADHLGIAPRSATQVVDELQERGLVTRQADPSDRRATLVVLTPSGKSTGQAIRSARRAESERVFGTLSGRDQETLGRILRALREAIDT
jgi:DNA-binding MarR family transcriptional regulator